jgi:hypothetical protein
MEPIVERPYFLGDPPPPERGWLANHAILEKPAD